ncbi:DUF4870 domain-containing protein [Demequina activiva]|uniref:DUF4870 domain-containing protein n=1 Tax=Demequina activiva TaxID=1582364 RepID=A0A919UKP4_9MICO|nr:DUF4870 domain-containing protein [Demequina activiva]GIG55481.1 hypothetical protein Dac01nite_22330 [Demequina activiva]
MNHAPQDGIDDEPDTAVAALAHLGAILGPVIPWLVWLARRGDDRWAAREAATATNFGLLVLVAFMIATAVREFVPLVAFLGTLGQLAVLVVAVVLCYQAFRTVRRGLSATYPYDIKVVRTQ